jgi:hypothetical protein
VLAAEQQPPAIASMLEAAGLHEVVDSLGCAGQMRRRALDVQPGRRAHLEVRSHALSDQGRDVLE